MAGMNRIFSAPTDLALPQGLGSLKVLRASVFQFQHFIFSAFTP
jgi:hypothetical protein